jgi:hypothetical protein
MVASDAVIGWVDTTNINDTFSVVNDYWLGSKQKCKGDGTGNDDLFLWLRFTVN